MYFTSKALTGGQSCGFLHSFRTRWTFSVDVFAAPLAHGPMGPEGCTVVQLRGFLERFVSCPASPRAESAAARRSGRAYRCACIFCSREHAPGRCGRGAWDCYDRRTVTDSRVASAAIVAQLKQREQLERVAARAARIREHLSELAERERERVYFRPAAGGVDMVSLLSDRPMQCRPAIKNVSAFAGRFEAEWQRYVLGVPTEKRSLEKQLKAHIIRSALAEERRLGVLGSFGEGLRFVTDNVPVPYEGRRLPCDLLAVDDSSQPVLIQVARSRDLAWTIETTTAYAGVVEVHFALYEQIFRELLGEDLRLEAACRRAVIWPAAAREDEREAALRERGIELVRFRASEAGFEFV